MPSPRSPLTILRAAALVLTLAVTGAATSAAAFADDPTPSPTSSPDPVVTNTPTPTPTPQSEPTDPATTPPSTTVQPRSLMAAPSTTAPARKVAPQCAKMPGGGATPYDASYFNYPFSGTKARNNIRFMVLRAINATPGCDVDSSARGYHWNTIRIAAFALNDDSTVNALINAAKRGAAVQVIADSHLINGADHAQRSPSFKRLVRTLAQPRYATSWAKVCRHSCRGTAGNHHYKMYLFSHTGAKRNVTMAGSANLTMKASGGQWNHLDVYTSKPTFDKYGFIFNELKLDRRAASGQYHDFLTGAVRTWFFPRPGTKYPNDPMIVALNKIGCSKSGFGNGRTVIRIGMYSWYEERGLWMAKKVRQLWNAGCNIAIEYALMGNTVKKIVYSPAGRGRIPMRQVATYYRDGTVANYDHQKYVTVAGRYAGRSKSVITWTGSTNWSNLGFYSDDLTQVWSGDAKRAAAYRNAFNRVWRGPHTRVPSPTSKLPGKVGKGKITFGAGKYRNLEAN